MAAKKLSIEERLDKQERFNDEFSQRLIRLTSQVGQLEKRTGLSSPKPPQHQIPIEDMRLADLQVLATQKGVAFQGLTRTALLAAIQAKTSSISEDKSETG